ncbi:hypothetical protein SAMN04487819_103310 [Actinopolyspora alba]|uniref:DivIVA protein n=1 Tax=Actinopolyspora alba TaxID=673379 RepID=A0A1I1VE81_9ACTN|nr:cellulose-binding protein [Actinopolyspora alba]SFD81362.1 hypothetical protein SAMN04487819_103310 [Actinopolyspora alba]
MQPLSDQGWGETVGHNDSRELVPLESDFDVVWRGFRRSQVQFYIQQTEAEVRMLTEDRDSALSQVSDLNTQLEQARAEIDSLRRQLDDVCRTPVEEKALSDRLRRMVQLANDEAAEIISSARATAEHEWSRSEKAASELRARYERLVAEADEWRQQAQDQRQQALEQTSREIERMAEEAEQHRRRLDRDAERRRNEIERDFEISMAARREEAMRELAERDLASRQEAERRISEAAAEAERRTKRANEQVEAMRALRRNMAEQVRAGQHLLSEAEPFLAASVTGTESERADDYVRETTRDENSDEMRDEPVELPRQRAVEQADASEDEDTTVLSAASGGQRETN